MNAVVRSSATKAIRCAGLASQQRGLVDYLTNYPDKVNEIKKIQMKGGTKLGEKNPTWMKQPGDALPLAFGDVLVGYGAVSTAVRHYRLATGKGKID